MKRETRRCKRHWHFKLKLTPARRVYACRSNVLSTAQPLAELPTIRRSGALGTKSITQTRRLRSGLMALAVRPPNLARVAETGLGQKVRR